MLEIIKVLVHSCIRINKDKVIYFDPFKILEEYHDAGYIFITHDHYDHFSEEDIIKLKNDNTKIVITNDLKEKVEMLGFIQENICIVKSGNKYEFDGIKFETIASYNVNKGFHPKENGWVGYIVEIDGIKYYIPGDTDIIEENRKIKCDVVFLPVGGTYTMNSKEAAILANEIKPKFAIPIHYGCIVGTDQDAIDFCNELDSDVKGVILLEK